MGQLVKFFIIFVCVFTQLIEFGLMCKLTGETCGAFYPTPCCNRCVISGISAWGTCR
ncbi:hypothetical protein WIV_gp169 [Wiseana iridescent virus]|uniref:Uncharacterized protein n=1 Tax=Wiseana iridescent virus TaxID=68347 RepID=G0T5J5_IRV9|nr:hypothetical protein WIV_gp169 [Wiseana iridescent virus]ADO00513.1 hypothetical protein [Wiseana iridescent virus]